MSKIYFTADQHHFHKNILYHEDRPFSNLPFSKRNESMEQGLINRHNAVVGKNDTCYHLGDFAFLNKSHLSKIEKILSRMNGKNILIMGNHDEGHPFTYMKFGFESVHSSLILPEDNRFILNHDPCASLLDRTKVWIVGHVHDLFMIQKNCINVGVDVPEWDFSPVSLDTIKEKMNHILERRK